MPGRAWHWAEDEWLRWCALQSRSAPVIAEMMPGRSEAAIVIRASVLRVHLAARGPVGAPVGNRNGRATHYRPGHYPARWRRAA